MKKEFYIVINNDIEAGALPSRFSYSFISTYNDCPIKAYRQFVKKEFTENKHTYIGKEAHSTIATYIKKKYYQLNSYEDKEVRDRLNELFTDTLFEDIDKFLINKSLIEVEKRVNMNIDTNNENIPFIAFFDLLLQDDTNIFTIIDWKTNKRYYEDKYYYDDFQLEFYAYLTYLKLTKENKKDFTIRTAFYFLDGNNIVMKTYDSNDLETFEKIKSKIDMYTKGIIDGLFFAKPEKQKCSWCAFKEDCTWAWEEKSTLAQEE